VLCDRTAPEPAAGEVLVRIGATSLNYRDLGIARRGVDQPVVPLSDGAGEVVAVGDGVEQWSPGDHVVAGFFRTWIDGRWHPRHWASALGGEIDGVLTELVTLPADSLVRVPAGWSFEEAATLPCAAVTAWNALSAGPVALGRDDALLVQGTGGVSIFALQLAAARGAEVVVTSKSDDKLRIAAALGATVGINYRTAPDWPATVREHLGRGVDHVVEVTGQLQRSATAATAGATISIVGTTFGADERSPIEPAQVQQKVLTIRGVYVGPTTMLQAVADELAAADARPVIDRVFDFGEAPEAYEALAAAEHVGKLVIRA
jgi:NADPH:quinone reductase-like Zn-dependent oxidoreductase